MAGTVELISCNEAVAATGGSEWVSVVRTSSAWHRWCRIPRSQRTHHQSVAEKFGTCGISLCGFVLPLWLGKANWTTKPRGERACNDSPLSRDLTHFSGLVTSDALRRAIPSTFTHCILPTWISWGTALNACLVLWWDKQNQESMINLLSRNNDSFLR